MQAEIVSIGDEMTNGQRLDTNSRWLSQQLADLGVSTVRHTTVADDLSANIDVFANATARADIVISTGGLGPTLDDLTRDALAAAFDRELELHAPSLAHIESLFAARQRPMPQRNRVQAFLPRGSQVIPNPHGTAPGIDLQINRADGGSSRIFALPGVPAEMVEMWHGTVCPRICQLLGRQLKPVMFHTLKAFGIGESDVEVRLPDLMRRDRYPRVGITVSRATISLRIAAQAASADEFAALIQPTVNEIQTALGELIFGQDEDELEHSILRLIKSRQARLAVLEIGPAALCSDWLRTAAYELPSGTISTFACDSRQHAAELLSSLMPAAGGNSVSRKAISAPHTVALATLAEQLKSICQADIALVCGTYASADELKQPRPAANVEIAIAETDQATVEHSRALFGHPDILNDRVAKSALDALRLQLMHPAQSPLP